jgi:hypothetical protein
MVQILGVMFGDFLVRWLGRCIVVQCVVGYEGGVGKGGRLEAISVVSSVVWYIKRGGRSPQ